MRSKKITPTRALMEILVHPDDLNEVWQVVEEVWKRRESAQKGLESDAKNAGKSEDGPKMSNYDVEADRREAFIEYKIDELLESRGYAPFIADNFDEALDKIDLYGVAELFAARKTEEAGELLSTLVTDYWRGEAREEAERLADRVDEEGD